MHGGISARWIILFGLLALSLVLLNGIAINVNQANPDKEIAERFCGQRHAQYPIECQVDQVFGCADHYVLRSTCVGVGDVVVKASGETILWCGYTTFGGAESPSCDAYERIAAGQTCLTHNLCI
ncbi:MAG: hypothetical protein HZC01_00815 [Candidatus Kerfeldbacteria bacterium]|nr:hypothetical protein [Candidatus Kerfeldbacteria bacterium]